jgi:hypothetical protein
MKVISISDDILKVEVGNGWINFDKKAMICEDWNSISIGDEVKVSQEEFEKIEKIKYAKYKIKKI